MNTERTEQSQREYRFGLSIMKSTRDFFYKVENLLINYLARVRLMAENAAVLLQFLSAIENC